MPAGSNEPDGILSYQRQDEEAVIDQGRTSNVVNIHYEKEELEGHRTLYVGVRMPLVRQSHRHHRPHGRKDRKREREKDSAPAEQGGHYTPSQRVQFILGTEEDEQHVPHDLFTELDEICLKEGKDAEWKETARWLKFEEDVEDGGERWSKPYVATLSLHSLFELRSCLINGMVLLDVCANSMEEIADLLLGQQEQCSELEERTRARVREVLLRKHHHQNERKRNNLLPIVRSFADSSKKQSEPHLLEKPAQALSPHPSPTTAEAKNGVPPEASTMDLSKAELHFLKKIPTGAEASNVLVGELDFLPQPIVAFVRLTPAVLLSGMTEVPIPTRFLFVLLGPGGKAHRYHEIGRSMATIMTDEVFHDVAYKAKDRADLVAGIDEFLDQVTVLPPGEWDPSIRIEPPKSVPSQEKRKMPGALEDSASHSKPEKHSGPELERTGRLFGGLILDVKRKAPWFWSDFRDGVSLQCLASFLFLYCACMSPVITFGGLLGEATKGHISAMESLLGASMTGVVYSLFAGQPLTILGSTGPVLVFEKILYKFCREHALSYLSLRACIGLWTAFFCVVLVATDASSLVCYITRFTEEAFASLICIIFIYEALEKLSHLRETYPVHMHSKLDLLTIYYCKCEAPAHPSNETRRFWDTNGINASSIAWENLTVTVSALCRRHQVQEHPRGTQDRVLRVTTMGFSLCWCCSASMGCADVTRLVQGRGGPLVLPTLCPAPWGVAWLQGDVSGQEQGLGGGLGAAALTGLEFMLEGGTWLPQLGPRNSSPCLPIPCGHMQKLERLSHLLGYCCPKRSPGTGQEALMGISIPLWPAPHWEGMVCLFSIGTVVVSACLPCSLLIPKSFQVSFPSAVSPATGTCHSHRGRAMGLVLWCPTRAQLCSPLIHVSLVWLLLLLHKSQPPAAAATGSRILDQDPQSSPVFLAARALPLCPGALFPQECRYAHGEFRGPACGRNGPYAPNVLFWCCILFFSTFVLSSLLKKFKTSRYFPTRVRSTVSDFAVFLAIVVMVLIDFMVGIPSPKLHVPHMFKPTRDDRGWLINPIGPNPWWTVLAALIPALLCTILIFMDQQITAVIVNRKEHRLKKGCGYHLDLFMVAVMLGVCSVMGLPWFVAATVLSITHVNSLKVESDCSAPGEQPKFLGIREQRVTGLMIFVLMGCSVFFTSALKFIPMPVLYGVFLYMGVSSLRGIQFFDRLKLFWMPAKHQPDFIYLRHVPLRKVLALVFVRKVMDFCFSKRELSFLDDLVPESKKKRLDDAKNEAKEEEESRKMMEAAAASSVQLRLLGKSSKLDVPKPSSERADPSEINISDEMPKTAVWKALTMDTETL
ncbi:electroneutral sodium bicarbonate exchanger 1 isoform X2 [Lathamus discolor]|uniref:electroneutral sodium bicarbonate exchanger 1 isoform X2 n=1 Tax=Lathamus discolor TaxID=678569 RepID=UPI0032B706D4